MGGLGARAVASSAVLHLDLFDLDRAEAVSREARELARTFDFAPAQVSAGIDLLLVLARRGDVSRVAGLLEEADAAAERTAGFHGWLWQLRLAEARAEIALARGEWPSAVQWADEAIRLSRQRGRVKYQALGLGSRAGALHGLGRTKEAIEDLREALGLAQAIGAPALCVRLAADLLRLAGDDALAGEARAVVERILAEVAEIPDPELRRRFEASEPVQTIFRLAPPRGS